MVLKARLQGARPRPGRAKPKPKMLALLKVFVHNTVVSVEFCLYSPGVAVAVLLGVALGIFIGMLLLVALHCARKR